MLKKLVATIVVLIILISASMAVFAGNPEGAGFPASSVINNMVKDAGQTTDTGKADEKNPTVQTDKSETAADSSDAAGGTGDNEKEEDPQAEIKAAVKKVLKSGSVEDNGQFLMKIKNPEDLSNINKQYSNIFNVSGETEYNDLIILLARLNKESGKYELMDLPDGDESIQVLSGYFSVVIDLELGENNILLISYRASEKSPKMIQYNTFTVEYYKETIPQKVLRPAIEKVIELKDTVFDLFKGKSK